MLTNRSIPGPKPRLAVMAAIHAREYTTAELATRFAEHLVAQYGVDADITWLLDYTEFHLIPIANPDGRKWAEAGYSWRKNTHDSMTCGYPGEEGLNVNEGVDLNRNSSFKWNGCTTYGCSSGICLLPDLSWRVARLRAGNPGDRGLSAFALSRPPRAG